MRRFHLNGAEKAFCGLRVISSNVAVILLLMIFPQTLKAEGEDFYYTTNNGTLTITSYVGSNSDVIIPDTINGLRVTSVGDYAFSNNGRITNVTIPEGVTYIGFRAFDVCGNLNSVSVPSTVTFIGQFGFENCSSLTSIDLPAALTSISDAAFRNCTNLTKVKIPDQIRYIGDWAFAGCTGLRTVAMPKAIIPMGAGFFAVFYNCENLSSITIPEGIIFIGDACFQNCRSLTNIVLPQSVWSIGVGAFGFCSSLKTVKIVNNAPPSGMFAYTIGYGAFRYCVSLTAVFIQGNAPFFGGPNPEDPFNGVASLGNTNAAVYYLPGTGGWGANYGGLPTAVWKPQIETRGDSFGIRTNQFGFQIAWASGRTIAVEACTNTTNFVWESVHTNIVGSDGLCYYADPSWTNHPARFYRVRWP